MPTFRFSLAISLFLLLLHPVLSALPTIIYRTDPKAPEIIWERDGFLCRPDWYGFEKDECMTYHDHHTWPEDIITANKDPWISTSADKEFAIFWAKTRFAKLETYVYTISTKGIEDKCLDIEEAYKKDGKEPIHSNEREIAVKNTIPWANVIGWYIIRPGRPPIWTERPLSLSPLKPNDPRKQHMAKTQPPQYRHWIETWKEDTGSIKDWKTWAPANSNTH